MTYDKSAAAFQGPKGALLPPVCPSHSAYVSITKTVPSAAYVTIHNSTAVVQVQLYRQYL